MAIWAEKKARRRARERKAAREAATLEAALQALAPRVARALDLARANQENRVYDPVTGRDFPHHYELARAWRRFRVADRKSVV